MGIDDPAAGKGGEPDVRECGKRKPGVAKPGECSERVARAGPVIRADRGDVERGESCGGLATAETPGELCLLVEGEQCHDRQCRDAADCLDRDDEVVDVEERLDHEEVDPATLEDLRLLCVERCVLDGIEHLELAERPDRAGDEHVPAGHLACLPREPDSARVEPLEVVLEHQPGELGPVRAERIRLDHVGAGGDVPGMDGDDAFGSDEVCLLGEPQTP